MLRWAGRSVAVANAHADAIAAAQRTTASNDDAGVAKVLEEIFADAPKAPEDLGPIANTNRPAAAAP
jgi:hypothetical protein